MTPGRVGVHVEETCLCNENRTNDGGQVSRLNTMCCKLFHVFDPLEYRVFREDGKESQQWSCSWLSEDWYNDLYRSLIPFVGESNRFHGRSLSRFDRLSSPNGFCCFPGPRVNCINVERGFGMQRSLQKLPRNWEIHRNLLPCCKTHRKSGIVAKHWYFLSILKPASYSSNNFQSQLWAWLN